MQSMTSWENENVVISIDVDPVQLIERHLQDCNSTGVEAKDAEILQTTFRAYGSFFATLFLVFCVLRVKFKKTFNVRSWVQHLQCPLAVEHHYGFIDWTWKMFRITDDEIREQCGMDALCFIRILKLGLGISTVGMLNAVWLVPSYATASSPCETSLDWYAKTTISNLEEDSPRLLATVIAIYIVFGYIFYQLLRDLEWFTSQRHVYLSRRKVQNYSVYVAHIPPEYRSNQALLSYFRRSEQQVPSVVLEAHVALEIPALEGAVLRRDTLLQNLEHAINVRNVTGRTPTHRNILQGNTVLENSINVWTEELVEANADVKRRIQEVERGLKKQQRGGDGAEHRQEGSSYFDAAADLSLEDFNADVDDSVREEGKVSSVALAGNAQNPAREPQASLDEIAERQETTSDNKKGSAGVFGVIRHAGSAAVETAGDLASTAVGLIVGTEDGQPRESGFVTFTKLSRAHAALQMVHHPTPFNFLVQEAPRPDDVWWDNVGRSHESLQIAGLLSVALTVLLCFFWTVPVAFVAGLAEVDSLKRTLPFLEDWVKKAPWLEGFLAQMAPLLIVLLNTILPYILEFISKIEGPISDALNQNSAFQKFSAFMIIQTFFISAISGSIWSALQDFFDSPELIISVLATSLIGQSTYFVQILLVQTFVGLGMELLRVTPIFFSLLRKCIGPNLTEKERNTAVFGFIRPLADVYKLEHFRVLSVGLLYFMVAFVYSAIAPLTNLFLGFCFLLMLIAYKHQFVYIYPTKPDTGGRMWTSFVRTCLPCLLIAQLALIGMLLLKKSALATPFMLPLIIITVLFTIYIRQQHFRVLEFLPSRDCLDIDVGRDAEGAADAAETGTMAYSDWQDAYLQPQLRDKEPVMPENWNEGQRSSQSEEPPPSERVELEADACVV